VTVHIIVFIPHTDKLNNTKYQYIPEKNTFKQYFPKQPISSPTFV